MDFTLEDFECPVCVNTMTPPIRMCVNHHSICDTCDKKLERCPICRGPKFGVRNAVMEQFYENIDVPCANASEGCTKIVKWTELTTQRITCGYSIRDCPLNCGWTGRNRNLDNHFNECHPNVGYQFRIVRRTKALPAYNLY